MRCDLTATRVFVVLSSDDCLCGLRCRKERAQRATLRQNSIARPDEETAASAPTPHDHRNRNSQMAHCTCRHFGQS